MAEWIKLDQVALDQPSTESMHGADIEVHLSPYDIPEAARGYLSNDRRTFVLEFRYITTQEPLVTENPMHAVTVHVGRHSQRLYRLEIDLAKLDRRSDQLTVNIKREATEAIRTLKQTPQRQWRIGSYRAAEDAIAEHPELVMG